MTGSVFIHEVLGHGLAFALRGSRHLEFVVGPGFAGWALGPVGGGEIFTLLAGIVVNAVTGFAALAILRFRRPCLTPTGLPVFWLATTESGHALGYTMQGLLFRQGDAAILQQTLGHAGAGFLAVALAGLLSALAYWALSVVADFVRDHYVPASLSSFRRAFLMSFTIPMALIVLLAPGLPARESWTVLAFDAGILVVLGAASIWTVRRMPPDAERKGHPISWRVSLAWAVGALSTFGITSLWLSQGVTVPLP